MKTIKQLAVAGACAVLLGAVAGCGAAPSKPAAAEAPKAKVAAPGQVAAMMKQAKFEVAGVYRNGSSYVVEAKGPSGNQVLAAVDGRTGKIIGLDVVKWAPGAKRVKRGSRGDAFTGDVYEFGVAVPVTALATWVSYEPAVWTSTASEWIEVETTAATWSEVTYEESVTEVAYESYVEEYSEAYDISLEEEVTAYEVAETDIGADEATETVEVSETATVETAEAVETAEDPGGDEPADEGGADDGGGGEAEE